MNIHFEITTQELKACFEEDEIDFNKSFEVKIGKEVFTCHMNHYKTHGSGWSYGCPSLTISAQGQSKRLQDIADAKALVHKTKEAHKEAQRKLAELQENK